MNCSRSIICARAKQGGFTLAEVLAALVFMAIVIPVAVHGLQVASLAGIVGQRKSVAARIADKVLNEAIVTGQYQSGSQRGVVYEGQQQYQWNLRSQIWTQDAMQLVTVQVIFSAQGKDYDVSLSTLIDSSLL
jgi:type II secretory pathway pseudopilin PulG